MTDHADDREVHDALLGLDRELQADRPARGSSEPGRLEEARTILERVQRRCPVAGDDVEAAERGVGAGVDRRNTFGGAGDGLREETKRCRPGDARAAVDGGFHLVVLGDRAGHQHITREQVRNPAVALRERSRAQRADADGACHGDRETRDGHRGPVPGPNEMSRPWPRAADHR